MSVGHVRVKCHGQALGWRGSEKSPDAWDNRRRNQKKARKLSYIIEMVRDICREIPKMMRVTNKTKDSRATASVASVNLKYRHKTAIISHVIHQLREFRRICLLLGPHKRLGQLMAVSR